MTEEAKGSANYADEEAAVATLLALAQGDALSGDIPAPLARFNDADLTTGLRLQLRVLDAWCSEGKRLGGWKIGQTSRAGRDSLGAGVRSHGYVLAERIYDSGQTIVNEVSQCRLEAEIGLTLGTDLSGPDVTAEQAREAVESVAPAFEIDSVRVPKKSSMAVRFGNALNIWGIVMGDGMSPDEVDLAALTVEIGNEHGALLTGHTTPDVLDDPYLSLARVCRTLALNGRGLHAGEKLVTGSITDPVSTIGANEFYADFTTLGRVSIAFR